MGGYKSFGADYKIVWIGVLKLLVRIGAGCEGGLEYLFGPVTWIRRKNRKIEKAKKAKPKVMRALKKICRRARSHVKEFFGNARIGSYLGYII